MRKQEDDTTNTTERVTLTDAEFCRRVGISRTKSWRLRKEGRIPYLQVGGRIMFLPEHADEYLASCEIPAKGPSEHSKGGKGSALRRVA
jgi:Helix-turn-helix domain